MLYQRPSFTLPTSNPRMTQQDWDRAFLSDREFEEKYLIKKYPKKESKMDKSQPGTRM